MKLTNTIYTVLALAVFGAYLFWPEPEYEKTVEAHIVSRGETVWHIAEDYFDQQNKHKYFLAFMDAVYDENKHLGKYIQPGDVVYIPLEVEKK